LFYPSIGPQKANKSKNYKGERVGGEEKAWCEEIVSFGWVFIGRNGYHRFY